MALIILYTTYPPNELFGYDLPAILFVIRPASNAPTINS
jgi:hypothetical protein